MPYPIRRSLRAAATVLAVGLFSVLGMAQERLRPGPWTRERIPDGWVVFNSKNYHVQCECGMDKAKRLAEHMEAMNKTYRSMFKPDKGGERRRRSNCSPTKRDSIDMALRRARLPTTAPPIAKWSAMTLASGWTSKRSSKRRPSPQLARLRLQDRRRTRP